MNNKINRLKHTVSEYPEGIYYSLNDFLNKKVSHIQGGIYIGNMETSKNTALEVLENFNLSMDLSNKYDVHKVREIIDIAISK